MPSWSTLFDQFGERAEAEFVRMRQRLERRLNGSTPVHIIPYNGHGTERVFYVRGRVLVYREDAPTAPDHDSLWRNLVDSYRRMESDEVPYARLCARYGEITVDLRSDAEGYFNAVLHPPGIVDTKEPWQEVRLTLAEPTSGEEGSAPVTGCVLVPPQSSRFGVISDIDDTVLQTHVTDLLKMARLTFLHNARTRLPFAGVAAFYRALQDRDGVHNPIFYVSSSPWNLYDLLTDFFDIQEIPAGPLFLRDYGLHMLKSGGGDHHGHKLTQIRHILETHTNLPFILIGDSGQQDPEIYRQVVEEFPDRILAIYIRDVSADRRDAELQGLIEACATEGVDMLLVPDTDVAAQHAADHGWIRPESIAEVKTECEADKRPPSAVERKLEML